MNQQQITASIAAIITSVCGWAVGKGYISADLVPDITAAAVALITLGGALYASRNKALVASVAARDDVQKIVMKTPEAADEHPSEKVVPPTS